MAIGSGLYQKLWLIPLEWNWLACTYVVILEIVLIWGLLSRHGSIRFLTLAQLAAFHLQSLTQIHWYYPALMATILTWFIIAPAGTAVGSAPNWRALMSGRAPAAAYAVMSLFGAFQVLPHLYSGDKVLNGQGRSFALHMFEARQVCSVPAVLRFTDGSTQELDLLMKGLPPRMRCDPIVYFNRAKNLCRTDAPGNGIADLHLQMRSKRSTDPHYRTIIDEPDFCDQEKGYDLFRNNSWLR